MFFSRPRRFGKSLLLSTFEAYFLDKKDLFTGLAIEKLLIAKNTSTIDEGKAVIEPAEMTKNAYHSRMLKFFWNQKKEKEANLL